MAKTSSWGYTNNTDSQESVTLKLVNLKSQYSGYTLNSEESKGDNRPNNQSRIILSNRTAPRELDEKVMFAFRPLQEVRSFNLVTNPGKIRDGLEFRVRLDANLRTEWDNGDVVDDPQVMELVFRGAGDGNVTAATVEEQFVRLISSCYDFTNDRWRFGDLLKQALEVETD